MDEKEFIASMEDGLKQIRAILEPMFDKYPKHKDILSNVKAIDDNLRKCTYDDVNLHDYTRVEIAFGTAYRACGDALREINKAFRCLTECEKTYMDLIKSKK